MNEKFIKDFEYFKELINNKEFEKTLQKYSWLSFFINSMLLLLPLSFFSLVNNVDIYLICSLIIISLIAFFKYFKKYELINKKIKLKESYKVYSRYNNFKNSIYKGSLLELFNERDEIINYAITKYQEDIISNYEKYNGISGFLAIKLIYFISDEEEINKLKMNKKRENYIKEIKNIVC